jgi:drug/metabolite transporter (DMT)-like permease
MFYTPVALALYASTSFACSEFLARLAVRHASPYTGSLMQAVIHLIIFGALALWASSRPAIDNQGAWWFLASGALDPGLGVICYFAAFARIGVARAATVLGTSPLFSAVAAMILVGERPNAWVWVGTLAIVVGVGALAYEPKGRVQNKMGYLFATLAALCFALAHAFRKVGIEFIPSSVTGMAIGNVGAVIALILVVPLLPAGSRLTLNSKGLAYYFVHTLGIALALYLLLEGLRLGSVTVVVPLVHTFPLLVILLAWIFLREKEQITARLLLGAVLIVVGAAAITGLGHG